MTNMKRTLKGLLAALLSLAMTVAMCVSMFASAADTATETVVVQQKIEKGTVPSQTSYTYLLTPENTAYPLPKELAGKTANSKGQYEVGTITGDSTDKTELTMTFEIEKSEPGTYVYYLEKTPETPSGETFTLEKWKFGFRVTTDEKTGKVVAFPEVCVGGDSKLSDYDADGYPMKLTMTNSIKGKTTTTTTTTTPTKKGQTTRTYTTYRNGTTGTTTRGRYVNTGDESQLLLWVVVLGVAVAGLLIVILLRKRRDNDDEENY